MYSTSLVIRESKINYLTVNTEKSIIPSAGEEVE